MRVSEAMIERACVAMDGPDWRKFNASLYWGVKHALEAALTEAD